MTAVNSATHGFDLNDRYASGRTSPAASAKEGEEGRVDSCQLVLETKPLSTQERLRCCNFPARRPTPPFRSVSVPAHSGGVQPADHILPLSQSCRDRPSDQQGAGMKCHHLGNAPKARGRSRRDAHRARMRLRRRQRQITSFSRLPSRQTHHLDRFVMLRPTISNSGKGRGSSHAGLHSANMFPPWPAKKGRGRGVAIRHRSAFAFGNQRSRIATGNLLIDSVFPSPISTPGHCISEKQASVRHLPTASVNYG